MRWRTRTGAPPDRRRVCSYVAWSLNVTLFVLSAPSWFISAASYSSKAWMTSSYPVLLRLSRALSQRRSLRVNFPSAFRYFFWLCCPGRVSSAYFVLFSVATSTQVVLNVPSWCHTCFHVRSRSISYPQLSSFAFKKLPSFLVEPSPSFVLCSAWQLSIWQSRLLHLIFAPSTSALLLSFLWRRVTSP